jgi:endonuclease/exonuclease/phosphatase family metal-dependent hydrolase
VKIFPRLDRAFKVKPMSRGLRPRPGAGRIMVLALAAACAACVTTKNYLDPSGPRYAGNYTRSEEVVRRPEGPVRVVTFNIAYGKHIDRAVEVLRESDPLRDFDALALQEMDAPGVEQIARELGLSYVYFPGGVHPDKQRDFGCAILSPWPLEKPTKVVLPHEAFGSGLRRAAVAATIIRGAQRFRFYSVHLPAPLAVSAGSRREQVQVLIADAEASPEPVIIAGDFNSYGIGKEFVRAGFTWITRDIEPTVGLVFLRFRYDHIFAKGLQEAPFSAEAGVVADNRRASNHRPVWAAIEFAGPGSSIEAWLR